MSGILPKLGENEEWWSRAIGEKAREKKCRVYVCFIVLEKAYDRVN